MKRALLIVLSFTFIACGEQGDDCYPLEATATSTVAPKASLALTSGTTRNLQPVNVTPTGCSSTPTGNCTANFYDDTCTN